MGKRIRINPDLIYPIGSIYMSVNNVSPTTLFGGTWEQIQNRFLLGAGSSYTAGSTGGANTVSLSVANLPAHNHTGTTNANGNHSHTGNTKEVRSNDGTNSNDTARPITSSADYYGITITNEAGSHQHTFTTDNTGNGTPFNNMPPYLVVYMWKRTK